MEHCNGMDLRDDIKRTEVPIQDLPIQFLNPKLLSIVHFPLTVPQDVPYCWKTSLRKSVISPGSFSALWS